MIGGASGASTGAVVGMVAGPVVGGISGAGIGAYIGYRICSGGEKTCEKADTRPWSPSPPQNRQQLMQDIAKSGGSAEMLGERKRKIGGVFKKLARTTID